MYCAIPPPGDTVPCIFSVSLGPARLPPKTPIQRSRFPPAEACSIRDAHDVGERLPGTNVTRSRPPCPAQCVPYGMRTMWVHAYQSHVWNSVASARIRLFGPQAVPGDLVLPAPGDVAERYPGDSAEASPRDVAGPSPEDVAEPSPVDVSAPPPGGVAEPSPGDVSNPSPSPKASVVGGATSEKRKAKVLETVGKGNTRRLPDVNGREGQRVTVLTQAAIDEAAAGGDTPRELLRRVVLPLPGTSISYPSHEVRAGWECHGLDSCVSLKKNIYSPVARKILPGIWFVLQNRTYRCRGVECLESLIIYEIFPP